MAMDIKVRWTAGMQVFTQVQGHTFVMDAAQASGGLDTGPTPMQMILAGLCGCTAMDVVFILRKQRQDFTGVEVEVIEAERAEEHPKVWTKIKLLFTIKGRALKHKKVEDAVRMSQETYCSVSAMLAKAADISYEVKIIDEEAEAGDSKA